MDYKKAACYWIEKDAEGVHMDDEMLRVKVDEFIFAHNTCALATGCGDFIRCTPIEYTYRDGKFWILSEGGLKFCGLEGNKNVCLAIYNSFTSFNQLEGMQIMGTAEMVESWSDEYLEFLAYKNIKAENLKKLPVTLYLIKVAPTNIDFLCSEFKTLGVDSRQHLCL